MSKEFDDRVHLDAIPELGDFPMYEKGEEPFLEEEEVEFQSVANNTSVDLSQSLNEVDASSKGNSTGNLKSVVWRDMVKTTIDGKVYAICNHCSTKLQGASKLGTKHLHNHLARCKKRKSQDIKQMFLQVSEKKAKSVEYKAYSFNQEVSRNDLAEMIIMHEYPLSMVDHQGFRVYSNNLQPLFKMVSRNTIKGDILKIYQSKKAKILEMLDSLDSRVSITTNMWTAKPTKRGYMAITVHYINDSWVLQHRIMGFVYVPPPHNSDVLTEYLLDALMNLNLDRKLTMVTVDNATSNDAMLVKIIDRLDPSLLLMRGKLLHMRCCAHILNLIVKDGLDVIKKEVEKVRNSVVFWLGSRARIVKFEEAVRQLSISHTKQLILDCPTRWNSTYKMLETALLYKAVFSRLRLKERSYTCVPNEEDWKRVESISEKLKLFFDVTEIFSGTTYPTANEFFLKICKIKVALKGWVASTEIYISDMAKKMLEKYDKYCNECHEILGVACVLDPRYKMKLIEFYFPLIHGHDATFEIQKIRSCCYDFLDEYQSKMREKENVVNPPSSNNSDLVVNVNDPLSSFDKYLSSTSSRINVLSELDHYLEELNLLRSLKFDVLAWWKTNGAKFPTLQMMARDIFAIPVSSVASESAFSTSGRLVSPQRSRLSPNIFEALMCTQNWLRNENEGFSLRPEEEQNLATCLDDVDE